MFRICPGRPLDREVMGTEAPFPRTAGLAGQLSLLLFALSVALPSTAEHVHERARRQFPQDRDRRSLRGHQKRHHAGGALNERLNHQRGDFLVARRQHLLQFSSL